MKLLEIALNRQKKQRLCTLKGSTVARFRKTNDVIRSCRRFGRAFEALFGTSVTLTHTRINVGATTTTESCKEIKRARVTCFARPRSTALLSTQKFNRDLLIYCISLIKGSILFLKKCFERNMLEKYVWQFLGVFLLEKKPAAIIKRQHLTGPTEGNAMQ